MAAYVLWADGSCVQMEGPVGTGFGPMACVAFGLKLRA